MGVSLNHPNVVNAQHMVIKETEETPAFEFLMVMDYIEGQELADIDPVSEEQMWQMMRQALEGAIYLINNDVIIWDLHAGNAMMRSSGDFIWVDLGGFKRLYSATDDPVWIGAYISPMLRFLSYLAYASEDISPKVDHFVERLEDILDQAKRESGFYGPLTTSSLPFYKSVLLQVLAEVNEVQGDMEKIAA